MRTDKKKQQTLKEITAFLERSNFVAWQLGIWTIGRKMKIVSRHGMDGFSTMESSLRQLRSDVIFWEKEFPGIGFALIPGKEGELQKFTMDPPCSWCNDEGRHEDRPCNCPAGDALVDKLISERSQP